jgi:hypothetical protein
LNYLRSSFDMFDWNCFFLPLRKEVEVGKNPLIWLSDDCKCVKKLGRRKVTWKKPTSIRILMFTWHSTSVKSHVCNNLGNFCLLFFISLFIVCHHDTSWLKITLGFFQNRKKRKIQKFSSTTCYYYSSLNIHFLYGFFPYMYGVSIWKYLSCEIRIS